MRVVVRLAAARSAATAATAAGRRVVGVAEVGHRVRVEHQRRGAVRRGQARVQRGADVGEVGHRGVGVGAGRALARPPKQTHWPAGCEPVGRAVGHAPVAGHRDVDQRGARRCDHVHVGAVAGGRRPASHARAERGSVGLQSCRLSGVRHRERHASAASAAGKAGWRKRPEPHVFRTVGLVRADGGVKIAGESCCAPATLGRMRPQTPLVPLICSTRPMKPRRRVPLRLKRRPYGQWRVPVVV